MELVASRAVGLCAALESDGAGHYFAAWTVLLATLGIGLFVLLGLPG